MILMKQRVAIVGAGVSGLTCGVLFAERGYRTAIFATEIGQRTTSGVAGALWFPYDAKPAEKVIPWALETYKILVDLAGQPTTGVSMIELRQFSRTTEIQIPDWAFRLGAHRLSPIATGLRPVQDPALSDRYNFKSGFALRVPLMDTTIYLAYLASRFREAGGEINANVRFGKLEEVDPASDLLINCAGIGARDLVQDGDLEPHRGQVAIVPKINVSYAIVCDDPPLMYAIPRTNDCLFGGTNEISEDFNVDLRTTSCIVDECSRVLNIDKPNVLSERVGLRPFRRSGVRLERDRLGDRRMVIHNYGHGGAGFTLSWACAGEVVDLALQRSPCGTASTTGIAAMSGQSPEMS